MPDLKVAIANCPITGENTSDVTINGKHRWVRNHVRFLLSGFVVDWYQQPGVILGSFSDINSKTVATSTCVVRDLKASQERNARTVVKDLCALLSFATQSQVNAYAFEFDGRSEYRAKYGITMSFRPIIDPADGAAIRIFVEASWKQFRTVKRSRRLHEVFGYLVTAELPQQPLEVKFLIAFVVLESLKATFAKGAGIPFVGGHFRKVSTPQKANPRKEPRYGLLELLGVMMAERRLRRVALANAVKLRNRIIHFGILHRPIKRNVFCYDRLRSITHRYLLRLLDYRGPFLDYATRGLGKR